MGKSLDKKVDFEKKAIAVSDRGDEMTEKLKQRGRDSNLLGEFIVFDNNLLSPLCHQEQNLI